MLNRIRGTEPGKNSSYRNFIFAGWLCLIPLLGHSQKDFFSAVVKPDTNWQPVHDSAWEYAQWITPSRIREHIQFLASDSCEGRELGTRGNDRAGNYIADYFSSCGLKPAGDDQSYFQHVAIKWMYWDKLVFKINGVTYKQLWDYLAIPSENGDLELTSPDVLFLGYGIDDPMYSDYEGVNVRGKTILIYKGEPKSKSGNSYLTGRPIPSTWSTDLERKIEAARKHGVRMVLIIEDHFKEWVEQNRSAVLSPQVFLERKKKDSIEVNRMYLSSTTTSMLLGKQLKKVIKARDKINKSGKPQRVLIETPIELVQMRKIRSENGRNVVALIQGQDTSEEAVIVSAHYDHIGMRGKDVFNGADDNASGTSSLMEIACTFQELRKKGVVPRRSVLFILMTGEEKGLLGSMFYVHNPILPLERTMVDINVDMIGRTDDQYKTDSNYIYVIGSDRLSADLHEINLQINQKYTGVKMDHRFNSEADPNRFYYRSDHYNFAEKGIPAIFFFSGVHEDYHRITDDVEKIMFGKTAHIARHIFLLTWELANLPQAIRRNNP